MERRKVEKAKNVLREYLGKPLTSEELINFLLWIEILEKKAWLRLSKRSLSAPELLYILKKVDNESVRKGAWEMFLKLGPTNVDLIKVMAEIVSLREEAWQEFLKRDPTVGELAEVRKIKSLKKQAEKELVERYNIVIF